MNIHEQVPILILIFHASRGLSGRLSAFGAGAVEIPRGIGQAEGDPNYLGGAGHEVLNGLSEWLL